MIPAYRAFSNQMLAEGKAPPDLNVLAHRASQKFDLSITDIAKPLSDNNRCPFGELKSSDGSSYIVKQLNMEQIEGDISMLKYNGNLLNNSLGAGEISSIVYAVLLVVALVAFFVFSAPIGVIAVPAVLGAMLVLTVALAIRDRVCVMSIGDNLGKAHVLYYQNLAHNLICGDAPINVDPTEADSLNTLREEISKWKSGNVNVVDLDKRIAEALKDLSLNSPFADSFSNIADALKEKLHISKMPIVEEPQPPVEDFFISHTGSLDLITKRYRELALMHHKDRGGDEKIMQIINNQYEQAKKPFES